MFSYQKHFPNSPIQLTVCFADRELGLELRQRVWDETRDVLIDAFPETAPFFATLSTEPVASLK